MGIHDPIISKGGLYPGANPVGPADAAFSVYPLPNQKLVRISDIKFVNPASTNADVAQNLVAPQTTQVLFNQQPAPLSSGGIAIPNSSCVFKNPS